MTRPTAVPAWVVGTVLVLDALGLALALPLAVTSAAAGSWAGALLWAGVVGGPCGLSASLVVAGRRRGGSRGDLLVAVGGGVLAVALALASVPVLG